MATSSLMGEDQNFTGEGHTKPSARAADLVGGATQNGGTIAFCKEASGQGFLGNPRPILYSPQIAPGIVGYVDRCLLLPARTCHHHIHRAGLVMLR